MLPSGLPPGPDANDRLVKGVGYSPHKTVGVPGAAGGAHEGADSDMPVQFTREELDAARKRLHVESDINQICYYSVVKYVADPDRDEPVNVGVILVSPGDQFTYFRFLEEEELKRKLSSNAHFALLCLQDLANYLIGKPPVRAFLEELKIDYAANCLRFSSPRGCLTSDPQCEIYNLFARLVRGG